MMVKSFHEKAKLSQKKAIFDILDAATAEDDQDEEENEIARFLKTSRPPEAGSPSSHPQRSTSFNSNNSFDFHLQSSVVDLPSSSIGPVSSSPVSSPPVVDSSQSIPAEPPVENIKAKRGRKRKREKGAAVPEVLQIFKGLSFYFVPNDDIAPARKARILKAVERGALWERDFKSSVSHVIVDNGLSYDDVFRHLKITLLPANTVVVNENYPSSCLSFNYILDSSLLQYQVKGQPQAKMEKRACGVPKTPSPKPAKRDEVRTLVRADEDKGIGLHRDLKPLSHLQSLGFSAVPQEAGLTETLSAYSLDEAIKDAYTIEDLPLDSDGEESSTPSSPRSFPNPDQTTLPDCRPLTRAAAESTTLNPLWQQKFHCMRSSAGTEANPNARTIEILQQMATHYDRVNDHWRTTAYRKAISVLRRHSTRICTKAEALAMHGIGDRLADKIEEIVQTDNLRFLQKAAEDPLTKALKTFLGIYQVGSIQASAWVSQGFRTLDDLVTNEVDLVPNQRIGLEHYNDFNQRIPREEMDEHARFVQNALARVDNAIEVTVGGSYRRGAKDSGDIDFILASPQNMSIDTLRTVFFDTIVPRLYGANYLKYALAATNARSASSKWHGACALFSASDANPPWRRIDFLLVPHAELGAAMLYFTGNDIFNRSMRLLARKKGMRLNQRGLWKGVEGGADRKGGEGGRGGTLVAGREEREIFAALGVQWREAWERNV